MLLDWLSQRHNEAIFRSLVSNSQKYDISILTSGIFVFCSLILYRKTLSTPLHGCKVLLWLTWISLWNHCQIGGQWLRYGKELWTSSWNISTTKMKTATMLIYALLIRYRPNYYLLKYKAQLQRSLLPPVISNFSQLLLPEDYCFFNMLPKDEVVICWGVCRSMTIVLLAD